jgi:hypothetical protein
MAQFEFGDQDVESQDQTYISALTKNVQVYAPFENPMVSKHGTAATTITLDTSAVFWPVHKTDVD